MRRASLFDEMERLTLEAIEVGVDGIEVMRDFYDNELAWVALEQAMLWKIRRSLLNMDQVACVRLLRELAEQRAKRDEELGRE